MKVRDLYAAFDSPTRHVRENRLDLEVLGNAHREVFDSLIEVTSDLTPPQWATPTGCPGQDVYGHLFHCVALERSMTRAAEAGVEVATSRDIPGRVARRPVEARTAPAGRHLWEHAVDTFARRLTDLTAKDQSLVEPRVAQHGTTEPQAALLRRRLFDLVLHEQDLRRALGRRREPPAGTAHLIASHLLCLWSRHWPATLPGAGVVGVDVLAPVRRTAHIQLGDADECSPRILLRGSLSQLLPLAAGRSDAPDGSELLAAGDEQFARRVIAAAAIDP